jgi:hypothetical protein
MVSRDDAADDDDGAHDLVMIVTMLMLPGEWYVLCSRPLPVIPP